MVWGLGLRAEGVGSLAYTENSLAGRYKTYTFMYTDILFIGKTA